MNYLIIISFIYSFSSSLSFQACHRDLIQSFFHLQAEEIQPIAEQGLYGMYDIRLAREALLQGEVAGASKFIDEAARLLTDQSTDWARFTRYGSRRFLTYERYVAINWLLTISDDDAAKPCQLAAIGKVYQSLQRGHTQRALMALHLANIRVVHTTFLLPLQATQQAVSDAQKLLNDQRYDEANMVLKSVEDSLVIDSVTLD